MAKSDIVFAAKDKSGQMATIGTSENGRPAVLSDTVVTTDDLLQMLKKQVRADDFTDDDDYLQSLLDAAEEFILVYTNRTKDELIDMGGGDFPRRKFRILCPLLLSLTKSLWRTKDEGGTDERMAAYS